MYIQHVIKQQIYSGLTTAVLLLGVHFAFFCLIGSFPRTQKQKKVSLLDKPEDRPDEYITHLKVKLLAKALTMDCKQH